MEQQMEEWLSIFNNDRFKEILGEVNNPQYIITSFLLPDGINIDVFKANLLFLEIGMLPLYQGEYEPSESILKYESILIRPVGYPEWFIAAYPDTIDWVDEKVTEDKSNLSKITQKDFHFLQNESNFINGKFSFEILRNILDYYKNANMCFECSKPTMKFKTVTGSILLDNITPPNMKAMLLEYEGNEEFNNENFFEAITKFSDAISYSPNYLVYFKRGICYSRVNIFDYAIRDLTTSIELKPDFGEAYHARGVIFYIDLNRKNEGCTDLRRACELGVLEAKELYDEFCKRPYS
jgi:tetratricopeptide (TPR) repeat protein